MKYITILIIALFLASVIKAEQKVYVPNESKFVLSEIGTSNKSINDIVEVLGYKSDLYYTWFSKDFKYIVCYKILSSNIICILTEDDCGEEITQEQLKQIYASNNYSYKDSYPVYQRESDLDKGINGKYLTIKLMEEFTHKRVVNDQIVDELNDYIYTFKDGRLVSYSSPDGLIGYAKEAKGTPLFFAIKAMAEKYNHNQKDILDEINMQFYYFERIKAEYISLGKSEKYNNNYALLYVDLYCPQITMADFLKVVHNQAEVLSIKPDLSILKYNLNYYLFDSHKILKEIK